MEIYPTVIQRGQGVTIELRQVPDQLAGYIGVRKDTDFKTNKIKPAEVIFNMSFNGGNRMVGYTPDEAADLADVINQAATLCSLLDHYIQTKEDFSKKITASVVARRVIIDVKEPNE